MASPYIFCANDNNFCKLPNETDVFNIAYGNGQQFHFRNISGQPTIKCDGNLFGLPGNVKPNPIKNRCYYRIVPKFSVDQNEIPAGYDKCADEKSTCIANYPSDLLYGANGQFTSGFAFANQPIKCSDRTFGSQNLNVPKACYIKKSSITGIDTIHELDQLVQPPKNRSNIEPTAARIVPTRKSQLPATKNIPPAFELGQPVGPLPVNPTSEFIARLDDGTRAKFSGWNNINLPGFDMKGSPFFALNETRCANVCVKQGCNAYSFDEEFQSCRIKRFPDTYRINSRFLVEKLDSRF